MLGLGVSLTSRSALGGGGGEAVDVLFFAGQSNANSNGTAGDTSDVPTDLQAAMTDVYIWDHSTTAWLTYQAGVNSGCHLDVGDPSAGSQFWGPEAQVAYRWRQANPSKKLYIIKEAHSSTALDPLARVAGRLIWDEATPGELYDRLILRGNAALSSIATLGETAILRGLVWIQGESDCQNATAAAAYGTNLASFITAVRTNLIGSSCPVVIARVNDIASWTNRATVRPLQTDYAETTANTRWVSEDNMALAADGVHFNPTGVVTFGNRLWDTLSTGAEITAQYVARMTSAPDSTRQALLSTFFQSLVDGSVLWTLLDLKLLASHDQQSALLNVKGASFGGSVTGMTFVADRGFNGTGAGQPTSFLDTGLNPSTADPTLLRQTNAGFSFYIPSSAAEAGTGAFDFGAVNGGTNVITFQVRAASDVGHYRINTASNTAPNTLAVADAKGLWTIMRTATASQQPWRNGATFKAADTTNTGNLAAPNMNTYLGARNNGTTGTTRRYALLGQGCSRSTVQELAFYNAVNTYLTAIGAA